MTDQPQPDFATEEATVRAFFERAKRDRFVALLRNPKRRGKALDALNHFNEFDERFVTRAGGNDLDLPAMLRARGSPAECYVISDLAEIDARVLPLDDAIAETMSGGFASLLCCIPGRLALFIGEGGTGRYFILERP